VAPVLSQNGDARVHITGEQYRTLIHDPFVDEQLDVDGLVVVVVDSHDVTLPLPGALPLVVLALDDHSGGVGPMWADATVTVDDAVRLVERIRATPLAATTLAVHLRAIEHLVGEVDLALALESAAYGVLQAGPEFARWRQGAHHTLVDDGTPRVRLERDGPNLTIVLQRGGHNPIDARLRDELCTALTVAVFDDSVGRVALRAEGDSFSSGGDLGEFGQRSDPATAHHVRLRRHPGRLLHRLRERTMVHVHGSTFGGGLELAAFAGRVAADPRARFALPELSMGLMPGAGGTVSIAHRIGRQRTALLALSGEPIDVDTALSWGLVDEVRSVSEYGA
jgi:enoyl-CoA hydratase/carnithine racemase